MITTSQADKNGWGSVTGIARKTRGKKSSLRPMMAMTRMPNKESDQADIDPGITVEDMTELVGDHTLETHRGSGFPACRE